MSTIRDVARIARVSTATVSRVMNCPEKVRPQTRELVQQAMDASRYEYNALARGFVTKRSHTLGVIVPTISNPIFAESTRGVQDYAHEKGYQVILGNSYYRNQEEAVLTKVLRERQVEGLLITTTDLQGKPIRGLRESGFPFVLLYSTVRKGPVSAVGVDNVRGGYDATCHLIDFGHRRVAMLAGSFEFSDRSYHRWHGYRRCLKEHGICYDPALVIQSRYDLIGGRDGVRSLFRLPKPPTAIFCSNDFLAIGAMEGARELGLKLPDDISIVGFDDMEISSFVSPSLTTIRQPAYDMGSIGAKILLHQIETGSPGAVHEILETKLIIRQSTARAA